MVGVLSPDGEFKSLEGMSVEECLDAGYMVFKRTSVRFRKLYRGAGLRSITAKQFIWIEEHKDKISVPQLVDIKSIIGGE